MAMHHLPFMAIQSEAGFPIVATQLSQSPSTWPTPHVTMEQVHGSLAQEVMSATTHVASSDAIFTREKNLTLIVRAADCVPILFYSEAGIVGVIHAGRRGTQAEITRKTLETLPKAPLYIWIGPHICDDCYEINPTTGETYDLLAENLHQIHATVAEPHIQLDARCTKEDSTLHSYRREGAGKPMNYWGISLQ